MISYLYFSKIPINDDKLVNVLPIFLLFLKPKESLISFGKNVLQEKECEIIVAHPFPAKLFIINFLLFRNDNRVFLFLFPFF